MEEDDNVRLACAVAVAAKFHDPAITPVYLMAGVLSTIKLSPCQISSRAESRRQRRSFSPVNIQVETAEGVTAAPGSPLQPKIGFHHGTFCCHR